MSPTESEQTQTVLGPVPVHDLQVTSSHEHLICSQMAWYLASAARETGLAEIPLTLENIGRVRRDPLCNRENLLLDSVPTAVAELQHFIRAGGRTIVDLTTDDFGRSPECLRQISRETGCHIVMGCGFYVAHVHPTDMASRSVEDCATEMIRDITEGVRGTGIRAGLIGELGCSPGIEPNEEKVLIAGAVAQQETGAPIAIHQPIPLTKEGRPASATEGLAILSILETAGADVSHVLMCHMDHSLRDRNYQKAIAERGCMMAFDRFGNEWYYDSMAFWHEFRDVDRLEAIRWLIDQGFEDQILVGQDVCYRICLTRYGGWGYSHLLANIYPMFQKFGIDEGVARKIFVDNPRRFLAFRKPIRRSGARSSGPGEQQ